MNFYVYHDSSIYLEGDYAIIATMEREIFHPNSICWSYSNEISYNKFI